MKIDDAIAVYVKLRDHKDELKRQYNDAVASTDEKMKKIEAALLKHFRKVGQESSKTSAGTAYISRRMTASVADRGAFLKFVEEAGDDFMDIKPNVTAVQEYIDEREEPPPGVNISIRQTVNIQRGRTKR